MGIQVRGKDTKKANKIMRVVKKTNSQVRPDPARPEKGTLKRIEGSI